MNVQNETNVYPAWLESFVDAKFYQDCEIHGLSNNCYCKDCLGEPFCLTCKDDPNKHKSHQTLQLHKVSDWPSVRTDCVNEFMDTSQIQPYKINYHDVFLLRSKAGRNRKPCEMQCAMCTWKLKDRGFSFCSIKCQIESERRSSSGIIKQIEDKLPCIKGEEEEQDVATKSLPRRRRQQQQHRANSRVKEDVINHNNLRKRSRKGVPQRSPFY